MISWRTVLVTVGIMLLITVVLFDVDAASGRVIFNIKVWDIAAGLIGIVSLLSGLFLKVKNGKDTGV